MRSGDGSWRHGQYGGAIPSSPPLECHNGAFRNYIGRLTVPYRSQANGEADLMSSVRELSAQSKCAVGGKIQDAGGDFIGR